MIKNVYDMIQTNPKANIIIIDNPVKDKVELDLKHRSPLLLTNLTNQLGLTIEAMNYRIPGYIIKDGDTLISLDQLCNSPSIDIYKNDTIVNDYKLQAHYLQNEELFSNYMTCGSNYFLSLYRGEQSIPLTKNYREVTLLQPLYGSLIIYLFNPKHEKEIKGLENGSIKKWGIKVELQPDNLLYIPPEWYYFYECKKDVILSHIEYDSYSTFLFNYIRKK